MVAHVQTQTNIGASGTSAAVTISSTGGNTLVLVADAYLGSNTPFHISSISDSHNTWNFSTATSNQNPPVGQSWSGADTGLIAIGAVVNAAAITSVTATFSASLVYLDLIVYEFSGVPSGATIEVAASSSTLVTAASVTTPSVTVPGGAALAVAAQTNLGNSGSNTSVSSGWTLDAGADNCAAYQLSPAAGALTATFTSTSSQQWPSTAILAIGSTALRRPTLLPRRPFTAVSGGRSAAGAFAR